MSTTASKRLLSGKAWEDYCDVLKAAGRLVDSYGDELTELDRAEWYRFLTRLARSSMERFVENAEPTRPRLRDMVWRQSINVQSVDQDHLMCQFDEARDYRIKGSLGTVPYFVLAVITCVAPTDPGARDWSGRGVEGLSDFNPAMLKTTAFLDSRKLQTEPDGAFEIVLSQSDPGPGVNWLRLTPESNGVLIRIVYSDRATQSAPQMRIERFDGVSAEPVTPELVANNLAWAAQTVLAYAELVRSWWQGPYGNFASRPNRLDYSRAQYLSNGGVADRHVAFGSWSKRLDETLVLEFVAPDCEYWNFQLCNIWQENLDTFEDGNGYVTNYNVKKEADGRVRIFIAEKDPALGGNWVNSFGHTQGIWGLRLIQTQQTVPVKLWRLPSTLLKSDGIAALSQVTAIDTGSFVD